MYIIIIIIHRWNDGCWVILVIIIDYNYFQAQEKYWDLISLQANRFVRDVILT